MEIAMPTISAGNFTGDLVRTWVQIWVNACNTFRQWERQELLLKEPSPETLAQHKKMASAFIRTAHILEVLMEDADYPAREFLPEVQGKLLQLTDAREMIHNPMSDADYQMMLQKYFPDEQGSRVPA